MDRTNVQKYNTMISVIIPAYNAGRYIDNCLRSVMSQTDAEFEVIIVNDGSTDNTAFLCRKWLRQYKNITYIEQENMGQGEARNRAIGHASGEWLVFLDADDELVPYALHKLYKMTNSGADIICYEFFLRRRNSNVDEHIRLFNGEMFSNGNLLSKSTSFLWDKMFRTHFWRKNAISLDNGYGEDLKATCLLSALCGKFALLREPLIRHYERDDNLSCNPQKVMQIAGSVEETVKEFMRRELFDHYKTALFYVVYRQYEIYKNPDFCDFEHGQAGIVRKELLRILNAYFPEHCGHLDKLRMTELIIISYQYQPWLLDKGLLKHVSYFSELEKFILYNYKSDAQSLIYIVDLSREERCLRFGTRTDDWQKRRCAELAREFLNVAYRTGKHVRIFIIDDNISGSMELYRLLTEHYDIQAFSRDTSLLQMLTSAESSHGRFMPKVPTPSGSAFSTGGFWNKGEQYRLQFNENILNAWLMLKNHNKSFAPFFMHHGYNNVAIYGMGYLGKRLLEELNICKTEVTYIIDREQHTANNLPVYTPDDELPKADVIIVTVVHMFFEIMYELQKITDIPIVSLEEILETLLQSD